MKAFVTGGTGFIGSHLVDHLIESGAFSEIRCLVRSNEKWLSGKPYTKISGSVSDLSALQEGIKGVDVIFHVAGIVKAKSQREFKAINVDATENIIRIAQKNNVRNIIVLSSLAAAGPSSGTPVEEDKEMTPVSMYGESKKRMEAMIKNIASPEDSIKVIRPPAVYGPREDQILTFFKSCAKGFALMIGNGTHPKVSMVYVTDLIQGILRAAQFKTKGVHTFFISGMRDYTWNEIRDTTSSALGRRNIPLRIRPGLVKKIGATVESTASLFGKYPVINREKAAELIHEWTCSHKKAEQILNYRPTYTLAEGISKTIQWYKTQKWL